MSGWGPSVHDSQPYQGPAEREGGEREGEGGEREGEGGERWRKRGETEEVKSRMWRDDSSRTVQQCT